MKITNICCFCEGAGGASGAIEDTLKVEAIFRLFFVYLMQAIP